MDLKVYDETLRDGEQQIGVNFSADDKILLAGEIAAAGADYIDTMPVISKEEETLVLRLLSLPFGDKIHAATMLDEKYVDHSFGIGARSIILFSSLSDRLLSIKNITKNENLLKAADVCRHAKNKGMTVFFAGEDATRAGGNYIVEFVKSLERYIKGFLICDTVGILDPDTTKKLVRNICSEVSCDIGAHFHNDRGLANRNTVAAVESGANIISSTFGGIGERAGNADTCSVLLSLKKSGIVSENIDYQVLKNLRDIVYRLGGTRPARPFSARAFWHESGIHVNALLKDPLSYNSFRPEEYGHSNRFFFGKYSGVSGYKHLFGGTYTDEQLAKIRDHVKELSQKNRRSYSGKEIKELVKSIGF